MLMVIEEQDHEYLKIGKIYQKMSENRPPKTCPFYVYLSYLLWSSTYISPSMILGDCWQMLMVTEEQDHEYLQNGKRYQKMSLNRLPKTCPFYVYLPCLTWFIFKIWRFGRDSISKKA